MHNYSYFHPIEYLVVYHLHQSVSIFVFSLVCLTHFHFFVLLQHDCFDFLATSELNSDSNLDFSTIFGALTSFDNCWNYKTLF